jgi:hypothetical protein
MVEVHGPVWPTGNGVVRANNRPSVAYRRQRTHWVGESASNSGDAGAIKMRRTVAELRMARPADKKTESWFAIRRRKDRERW